MLQRRSTGRLDFLKRWRQYVAGFGNMTEEFWLGEHSSLLSCFYFIFILGNKTHPHIDVDHPPPGLEKIHQLTNTPTRYELRFDLGVGSERVYAAYDDFKVAAARQKFRLTVGKYSGTAGGPFVSQIFAKLSAKRRKKLT